MEIKQRKISNIEILITHLPKHLSPAIAYLICFSFSIPIVKFSLRQIEEMCGDIVHHVDTYVAAHF